jgi:hypothetical protein
MSQPQISRSEDLRRLRDDGYEVAVVGGHLTITHVPYVNAGPSIRYGTLVSELTLSGDVTARPDSHVAYFSGDCPCDRGGQPLSDLVLSGQLPLKVTRDLIARYTLSRKPAPDGHYADYYEKMTTYISLLGSYAQAIDPSVTGQTFRPTADNDESAVFRYLDTATSRAGIGTITEKLAISQVAIVGLGGTGSYVLDLVAKTPVQRIHLFDGDRYLQHNAFRAPGATALEDLQRRPMKADYYAEKYAAMRRGVVAHACRLDESNLAELDDMNFVFLALDDKNAKKSIIERLELRDVPFVDVGMGVDEVDGRLTGQVRTSVSVGPRAMRAAARARIPLDVSDEDMYDRNIQISDLNALNAALAVIAWKKLMGFYSDLSHGLFSAYAIDTNVLVNEDGT